MADHRERPGLFRNLRPLVLASASPRRRELLASLGISFEVRPAEVEEEVPAGLSPAETVLYLARGKALAVVGRCPEKAVLAADTVVVKEGRIFGKPGSPEEARAMLRELSGSTHLVFTGVALCLEGKTETLVSETRVRFRPLSSGEIEAYLATGEPYDKAGAYGIQGLAAAFVIEVHGSVTGVVGLPLAETVDLLLRLKIIAPASSG